MPLRVAVLVHRFPVLSETFVLDDILGLIRRGHEVHVYGCDGPPDANVPAHPEVERYDLERHVRHAPERPQSPPLRAVAAMRLLWRHRRFGGSLLVRLLDVQTHGRAAWTLTLPFIAEPFLGSTPYDIVHCQFGPLGLYGLALKRLGILEGRLITSFHGYDWSMFPRALGADVYRDLFEAGDLFIVPGDYVRQRLAALGCNPDRIVVHQLGVDSDRFHFRARTLPENGVVHVCSTGRLVEKKGFEYALQAVARAARTCRHIRYSIAGDGPLAHPLRRLAAELGISDLVRFLGPLTHPQVVAMLDESHIYLAPSVTARSGDQEGLPHSIKEAMAAGLPVLATSHAGIPEIVQDGVSGFLVPERDVDALADGLEHLIGHPELWEPMGRKGRTFVVERYDARVVGDELITIYEQVLTGYPERIGCAVAS